MRVNSARLSAVAHTARALPRAQRRTFHSMHVPGVKLVGPLLADAHGSEITHDFLHTSAEPLHLHAVRHLPFRCTLSNQSLLVLHSLFGSGRQWNDIGRALAHDCALDVHLIDLRNHGNSPQHDSHSLSDMVNDIVQYIGENGLDQISLLGHSMGGLVAMGLAAKHPELFKRLVVVDVMPSVPAELTELHSSYLRSLRQIDTTSVRTKAQVAEQLEGIPESVRVYLLSNLVPVRDANKHVVAWKWRINLDALERYLDTSRELFADFIDSPRDLMPLFVGRSLFLRGSSSEFCPDVEFDRVMAKKFPNSVLASIPNGSHFLHVDQRDAVLRRLKSFFEAP